MKMFLLTLAAFASLASSPRPAARPTDGIFCRVGALSPEERKQHEERGRKLKAAVADHREMETGYAFKLDSKRVTLLEIAEWVDGERRCCPFFDFQIEVEPHEGALWLRLGGGDGVKAFIRDEMQLASTPKAQVP